MREKLKLLANLVYGAVLVPVIFVAGLLIFFPVISAATGSNDIRFTDATTSTGLAPNMVGVYSHSAAWGDVNNDGYLDLFVGTFTTGSRPDHETPAPSMLLLGGADGKLTKSNQATLTLYARTAGAVFVDLNNDGNQDLVVATNRDSTSLDPKRSETDHVYKNLGDGTFQDITSSSGIVAQASSENGRTIGVLDYNHDGYQDLIMHADALVGGVGTMHLLKNNGNLTFTNVTAAAGLPTNISGLGMGVGDPNGDGWPDFIVSGGVYAGSAVGFDDFYLYINNKDGTFHGGTDPKFHWNNQPGNDDWAAGASWGDLNRDGRLDLIITQHFESTYHGTPLSMRIFINAGNDSNGDPILNAMPSTTLELIGAKQPHVEIQDFDNDGWPDIFTSVMIDQGSGHIQPYVYRNTGILDSNGLPSFTAPTYVSLINAPGTSVPYYAPGAPVADYDNDGKLDIFFDGLDVLITPTIWHNETVNTNHWLKVKVSQSDNTQGIGSKVRVYQAGHLGDADYLIGLCEITTGNGFSSAQPTIAHFGIGSATTVDVQVTMPFGGAVYNWTNIAADQQITITGAQPIVPTVVSTIVSGVKAKAKTTSLPVETTEPEPTATTTQKPTTPAVAEVAAITPKHSSVWLTLAKFGAGTGGLVLIYQLAIKKLLGSSTPPKS